MPNWCTNNLSIKKHEDFDIGRVLGKLHKVLDFETGTFDFNEVIPVPEELLLKELNAHEQGFACIPDVDAITEHILETELNKIIDDNFTDTFMYEFNPDCIEQYLLTDKYLASKYRETTPYEWRVRHWNTKWDGTELNVKIHPDELFISFDTPWSSPEPIIRKLGSWFPNDFDYYAYEPACELCFKIERIAGTEIHIDVPVDTGLLTEEEYNILRYLDEEHADKCWDISDEESEQANEAIYVYKPDVDY